MIAVLCFGTGLSAARGVERGMLLVPLFLACVMLAPPPWGSTPIDRGETTYLLWQMLIWGVGGLWALLVFPPLLRKRMKPVHKEPPSQADTIA